MNTTARLADVTRAIQYGYTAKSSVDGKGPQYLRITDVQNGHVDWGAVPRIEANRPDAERYLLERGDIVFARSGATVGKSFLIRSTPSNAIFASYLIRVRCDPAVLDHEYAAHFFASADYWAQIYEGATGTGQPNFNGTKLGELTIPVLPLPEQRRTVAKLDSLLAKSKAAREELGRVPKLVERYKQAVLAAAFRGELTAEWRADRSHTDGLVLRRHLLGEKSDRASSRKAKLSKKEELELTISDELPVLPGSWTWMSVDELSTRVSDGVHKKPDYVASGVPFLTVRNLTAVDGISFEKCRFVSQQDHEEFIKRTNPEEGDILISKDGTLGEVRAVRTDREFSIFVSVALIKPIDKKMSDYLELALRSPILQQQMVGVGTGLQHIHLTDLRRDLIPIAPEEERAEIVRRIKEKFGRIDKAAAQQENAASLVGRLEQAVLAKAFGGGL